MENIGRHERRGIGLFVMISFEAVLDSSLSGCLSNAFALCM